MTSLEILNSVGPITTDQALEAMEKYAKLKNTELLHSFLNWYNDNHTTYISNSKIGKFNLYQTKNK
jgi:hypothetical protein